MSTKYDLIIRNGTIVDGMGGEPYNGDVGVRDGKIVALGVVNGESAEEIDAKGKIVTPGFVDIHTHYDGQATWDQRMSPSSSHGVTTVLMGNCGIGFAPCRPGDRDRLVRLMEGVEDLPEPVLTAGLPWEWESFPEYLNFLDGRSYDIDIATQLPHAALRVYAMGERAVLREAATDEDLALMAKVAREAIEAGALGFATSRTINHRSSDGTQIPTLDAAEEELSAIANAVGSTGKGVLQLVSDFDDVHAELAMVRRVVEGSGRPISVSLMQWHHSPDKYKRVLEWLEACNADGVPAKAQVNGRPVGLLLGFELSVNPFAFTPTFMALSKLPAEERRAKLRDPKVRDAILSEQPDLNVHMAAAFVRNFAGMYEMGPRPDYEPDPDDNMAARAARNGTTPDAEAYDAMLKQDGRAVLMLPAVNYAEGNLEPAREMMQHPHTIYGLGDGGAHLGFLCDASQPTHMLYYWARDRVKGPRIPLPEVIRGLSARTAAAVGLHDRGTLTLGAKADINVIDLERVALHSPHIVYDLPAGGRRLTQDAEGYDATIVSGVVIQRNGKDTGARPGRLVRGAREAANA